jgi:alpha-tubulin suppressor-like RCC1 family protein
MVIDDHGVIYSMGSNRYGSLGRETYIEINEAMSRSSLPSDKKTCKCLKRDVDSSMKTVLLPTDVKFQKVCYLISSFSLTKQSHLLSLNCLL